MRDRCSMTPKELKVIKTKIKSIIAMDLEESMKDYLDNITKIQKILEKYAKIKNVSTARKTFDIEVMDRHTGLPRLLEKDFNSLYNDRTIEAAGISDEDKDYLNLYVTRARDSENNINMLSSKQKLELIMTQIIEGCKERSHNFEGFMNSHPESSGNPVDLIKKVSGYHQSPNPNLQYYISSDPVDIFLKSTGQEWSENSCERWGGQFKEGIFSDISIGSMVCFVNTKGKRNPVNSLARIMLRQCYVALEGRPYKHDLTLGLEAYWYTGEYRVPVYSAKYLGSVFSYGKSMSANDATEGLKLVLLKLGLRMNYKHCKTPFPYSGFSDAMIGSDVKIDYCSEYVECERCENSTPKSFADTHDGQCRDCYGE